MGKVVVEAVVVVPDMIAVVDPAMDLAMAKVVELLGEAMGKVVVVEVVAVAQDMMVVMDQAMDLVVAKVVELLGEAMGKVVVEVVAVAQDMMVVVELAMDLAMAKEVEVQWEAMVKVVVKVVAVAQDMMVVVLAMDLAMAKVVELPEKVMGKVVEVELAEDKVAMSLAMDLDIVQVMVKVVDLQVKVMDKVVVEEKVVETDLDMDLIMFKEVQRLEVAMTMVVPVAIADCKMVEIDLCFHPSLLCQELLQAINSKVIAGDPGDRICCYRSDQRKIRSSGQIGTSHSSVAGFALPEPLSPKVSGAKRPVPKVPRTPSDEAADIPTEDRVEIEARLKALQDMMLGGYIKTRAGFVKRNIITPNPAQSDTRSTVVSFAPKLTKPPPALHQVPGLGRPDSAALSARQSLTARVPESVLVNSPVGLLLLLAHAPRLGQPDFVASSTRQSLAARVPESHAAHETADLFFFCPL
ncbi:hypothetical protein GUJ93_ZPchr0009g880 [Zizania palustris]|uniref:Uncharacterized protein n=1 Tax=Zizania palustris TaxID=103762 RepID=A0A8J5RBW0_ZIZPA|nr:hypothetical protein GUJ93_ZPchr0009g880 [Zizania palustris]